MKYRLLILILIWAQVICAQINTKNKVLHQVELGVNQANFLTRNPNFNNLISGYHIGYKTIFNNRHIIKIHLAHNLSNLIYPKSPELGTIAMSFRSFNVGYGYILPFKVFLITLGGQISYRYEEGETAVYGYRNPTLPLSEPMEARLKYNSIGFSPNIELEYFITKHFGFGVNLNLNYYPFENSKLKGDGFNEPDPLFVETYKPNNLNLTATFKLAYKFSFKK